ncbi:hypothetical protein [Streptomyces zagrosensis]|uniref:Uncharacterized protein n=1 Tax=Streptomyces zagrosensis TaxID=1042984 RepID=A0A7W9QGE7_9ACTN|nr:hypothetical protein [Streptomyces zagrosensis]MBB5939253.1 hypothetical protein [Streptomyces zagrosensis]
MASHELGWKKRPGESAASPRTYAEDAVLAEHSSLATQLHEALRYPFVNGKGTAGIEEILQRLEELRPKVIELS